MTTPAEVSDIHARLASRYHITRLLGRGGMGAVHLARDVQLDRLVAIKELPPEFASDPTLRERFLREVRMAASFSHPNIVPVYAIEEQGDALAFVMGYVEGESLADRVKRAGPLAPRELVRLLLDVAYALAYAHGRGVVHRDIKPDNIMIERATGRALLMDFGVARSIGSAPTASAGMTRVGEVVGTPEYMSPEQATGEEIDGRSDLYSLGLVAHFAVTGAVAFSGESAARILVRQLTETLPGAATLRPDLPAALADAIDGCVAKERDDRFADAASLIEALDAAQAAAPEVPLAIRLLANELSTLQLVLLFSVFFSVLALNIVSQARGNLNALLPSLVLIAVATGRVMQTRSEARRIRADGFTGDDVQKGLLAVLAEREARRAQLRANAEVQRQRTSTVRSALFMLVVSATLVTFGLRTREPVNGNDFTPLPGVIMIFSGVLLFGFALVLLLRNPLKAPVDERIFRRLWLGPLGRWLFSMRAAPSESGAKATNAAIPVLNATSTESRLSSIEARLARLERQT